MKIKIILYLILIINLIGIASAQVNIGEDPTEAAGVILNPPNATITFDNNTQTVNASELWLTDEGIMDNVPDLFPTLYSEFVRPSGRYNMTGYLRFFDNIQLFFGNLFTDAYIRWDGPNSELDIETNKVHFSGDVEIDGDILAHPDNSEVILANGSNPFTADFDFGGVNVSGIANQTIKGQIHIVVNSTSNTSITTDSDYLVILADGSGIQSPVWTSENIGVLTGHFIDRFYWVIDRSATNNPGVGFISSSSDAVGRFYSLISMVGDDMQFDNDYGGYTFNTNQTGQGAVVVNSFLNVSNNITGASGIFDELFTDRIGALFSRVTKGWFVDLDVRETLDAGNVSASENVNASGFVYGNGTHLTGILPDGAIIMWSGDITNPPPCYVVANGSDGTPDLRDIFLVGAGGNYSLGDTGGIDNYTLSEGEIPGHTHTYESVVQASATGRSTNTKAGIGVERIRESRNTRTSSSAGGGQGHENRPPYYALVYLYRNASYC